MKEQGKNRPGKTNEEKIGSLPEKEFRVMIVKMIQNLRNRIENIQETFNKELEELKRKQTMMNNTINEINTQYSFEYYFQNVLHSTFYQTLIKIKISNKNKQ